MAFSGTIGSHRIYTHTHDPHRVTHTKGYEGFIAFTMFRTNDKREGRKEKKGKEKKKLFFGNKNLYSSVSAIQPAASFIGIQPLSPSFDFTLNAPAHTHTYTAAAESERVTSI